jgi:predicted transcriptional regulator
MATAIPLPFDAAGDDLDVAPLDWNDFTAEEQADMRQGLADIAAGRARLVPHAEAQRVIAEMRLQQGG